VSLVHRTSFEFMRTLGISRAYAIDADFESEGFELVS
jgi:predicted nucleic acid-binding protein